MLTVGQLVRVLEPFAEAFPGTYEISEVVIHPDGQVAYILGEMGGFAPQFVEPAE